MKKNILKDKSFDFAIRIVNMYKFLISEKKEYVKQTTTSFGYSYWGIVSRSRTSRK